MKALLVMLLMEMHILRTFIVDSLKNNNNTIGNIIKCSCKKFFLFLTLSCKGIKAIYIFTSKPMYDQIMGSFEV